jgi:hypothetical protein
VNVEDYFVILSWGMVTTNPFHFFKMEDFFVEKEFSSELWCRITDVILFGESLQQILSVFAKPESFSFKKEFSSEC